MGNDNGNDLTRAEQRDTPAGEAQETQRNWAAILASEAHHVGDTLLDAAALYGAKKALDKFRKPPPPPPPTAAAPPTGSSASDSEV
jgi:hypothetical protein